MKRTKRKAKAVSWDDAVDQFITSLALAHRSEHTIDRYRFGVEAFADWWRRVSKTSLAPSAISSFDLDEWSRHLQREQLDDKGRKRKHSTINTTMAGLTALLKWAASDRVKIIDTMPEIPPRVTVGRSPVAALTADQQRELLRHASHDSRVKRNRWIIQAMLETGVRLSEFLALKWGEGIAITDRKGEWQVVKGKGCKPRGPFPLSPEGLQAFKALKQLFPDAGPGDPVCWSQRREEGDSGQLRPLTDRGIQQMLTKYAEQLGWDGLHAHQLRHTFVLNLRSRGVDWPVIQALLGHSKVSTTMDHYFKPGKADFEAAMRVRS
jgi:site-specific recombinase XerD